MIQPVVNQVPMTFSNQVPVIVWAVPLPACAASLPVQFPMLGPTVATAPSESTTFIAHDPTTRATAKHGKKSKPKPGMSKSDLVKDCEKIIESEDITQWSDLPAPIKKAAWD